MNAGKMLQYLDSKKREIEGLITQLDEIQVVFNTQFDAWQAKHDAQLDRLTERVAEGLEAIHPDLRSAIEEKLPEERAQIEERRQKVTEEYLPQRQQAADALLEKAQAEMAELRELNPQLDRQEETLKQEQAQRQARLAELNEEIGAKSRGLGLIRHFVGVFQADRERQRIIGNLEQINRQIYDLRRQWERERAKIEESQAELQERWQLESVAVSRLQAELDQLSDEGRREALALRRAIRRVLDDLKEPSSSSDPDLDVGLQEMVEFNIQTDTYHAGLASVGGLIGLLRGIHNGMQAIRRSIDGLIREQEMHSAYLKPLKFSLPPRVEAFHKQWSELAYRFADESLIGAHPAEFSNNIQPLLEGPLSQANIERMFDDLGNMIKHSTKGW